MATYNEHSAQELVDGRVLELPLLRAAHCCALRKCDHDVVRALLKQPRNARGMPHAAQRHTNSMTQEQHCSPSGMCRLRTPLSLRAQCSTDRFAAGRAAGRQSCGSSKVLSSLVPGDTRMDNGPSPLVGYRVSMPNGRALEPRSNLVLDEGEWHAGRPSPALLPICFSFSNLHDYDRHTLGTGSAGPAEPGTDRVFYP